jgi:Phosphotransferase enzyme family
MIESANEARSIPLHILEIAEDALARSGRTPSGPPTLHRHWGISTLMTFPTEVGTVWFKYVPPIFSHEGGVTSCLAEFAPDSLPKLLASGKGWMLMEEFPSCDHAFLEHPLATLARIQHASVDHLGDLAAAGCLPLPLEAIIAMLSEFTYCSSFLTGDQGRALGQSLRHVEDACAKMSNLHIPTTVVHGDFYLNNAHWGPFGWIIYDWTDAFLGNPFIDVAYPLLRQESGASRAFQRVWLEILPPETVAQAMALGSVIGAAYAVVIHRQIMDHVDDPEPFRASLDMWLRQLSRLTR